MPNRTIKIRNHEIILHRTGCAYFPESKSLAVAVHFEGLMQGPLFADDESMKKPVRAVTEAVAEFNPIHVVIIAPDVNTKQFPQFKLSVPDMVYVTPATSSAVLSHGIEFTCERQNLPRAAIRCSSWHGSPGEDRVVAFGVAVFDLLLPALEFGNFDERLEREENNLPMHVEKIFLKDLAD